MEKAILDYNFKMINHDNSIPIVNSTSKYNSELNYIEIDKVIRKIKDRKAVGIDGISGNVIKHMYSIDPILISNIFSCIWTNGYFLGCWKICYPNS